MHVVDGAHLLQARLLGWRQSLLGLISIHLVNTGHLAFEARTVPPRRETIVLLLIAIALLRGRMKQLVHAVRSLHRAIISFLAEDLQMGASDLDRALLLKDLAQMMRLPLVVVCGAVAAESYCLFVISLLRLLYCLVSRG